MNFYTEEIYKLEQVCTSTKLSRVVLDAKKENSYLSKFQKQILAFNINAT